ncbi:hypothetical protein [Pacificispira sp.]|jgi:hypothetical protein|uniref:hypothetical protein n=1 Tax=Pacificispira sp. TaxID=2888761 RepID=UPI003B51F4AD
MLIRMAGPGPIDALYHAVRFDDLKFAERLAVWTLRLWNQSVTPDGSHRNILSIAYEKAGVPDAMPSIDGTLWAFRIGGHRKLSVGFPCAATLSEDERRILHLLSCYQAGAAPAARPVMDALAPAATARAVQAPLSVWAACLERAGLVLPMRDWDLPELRGPAHCGKAGAEHPVLH